MQEFQGGIQGSITPLQPGNVGLLWEKPNENYNERH